MKNHQFNLLGKSALLILFLLTAAFMAAATPLRPPSVPLVACDPYFSIWSPADKLSGVDSVHWTGKAQRMTSLVRVDGKTFRIMGAQPAMLPELHQASVDVLPTRSIYNFDGAGIQLTVTFMTAALPGDLDILSRPVTYLIWEARATDSQKHAVSVYFDASSEIATEEQNQAVNFEKMDVAGLNTWRVGTVDQPVLKRRGDDVRIDWGYFHVSAPKNGETISTVLTPKNARELFESQGDLKGASTSKLLTNNRNDSVIALSIGLPTVGKKPVSCWLMLAYDDVYSIQYMKKNLRPYWRRNGMEATGLLKAAAHDYESLKARCAAFDETLMADMREVGGENYAKICALAYRQCFAAGKIVADDNGQPLQFCKENHSNGCISTSDVFYPMSPQFLLFGPTLAKSFIVPFMNYASSERWIFPFAPHDLGTYPQANGQVYGDGERGVNNQMPVEETGNLLCLFGAVAQMEGNADFAGLYWKQLQHWAGYLKEKGFDPENQLCTDDFAGHLAHNVNLSAKAICGLGSYAKLCDLRGDHATAAEYNQLARGFAERWIKEANDGDHYRLAFDRPGSWSQKYNLVWDKILGLNLFPDSVAQKEMQFYRKMLNTFGLPLDNRETYTKLDWTIWTSALTQNRADSELLVDSVIAFLNATPERTPMTDWYQTKSGHKVGFDARPVVGGVFLPVLYNKAIWQKYASYDKTKASNWAPMPKAPKMTVVVPAADKQSAVWRYTTKKPSDLWTGIGFNDSLWNKGRSGFGTSDTPGAVVGSNWSTRDIWMRREVDFPAVNLEKVNAWLHHDEDVEVYINGVLALKSNGFITSYDVYPLSTEGKASLRPGKNLIALHCHQTTGGQYIDLGFVSIGDND